MARKLNLSKLPRQNNMAAEMLNRRPEAPTGALYLMQLREQSVKISSPTRRLRLEVNDDGPCEIAEPIEIKMVD